MSFFKEMLKQLLPPIFVVWGRGLQRRLGNAPVGNVPAGEKPQAWYDEEYLRQTAYQRHYTESGYYFLWTVIADRLVRCGARKIVDVGCGSGQFALLLADKGIPGYLGIDLSAEAIRLARQNCPDYRFVVADVFQGDLLEEEDYDCFVSLECLEHVEGDLQLIEKVRTGTRCFFTVPNFPYVSHVRHFGEEKEVLDRYRPLFEDLVVTTFLENSNGKKYFLGEGIRNGTTGTTDRSNSSETPDGI